MLIFHLLKTFPEGKIVTRWVESRRKIVDEVERAIDDAWNSAMTAPGVHLFDGAMCRLESWRDSGAQLELELAPTSYKVFLGTNMAHPELALKHGRDVLAVPIGVSPALITGDERMMLGVRNDRVWYYPRRLHTFSGALEPRDAIDLFKAVRRELHEELRLNDDDIAEVIFTGIAEDVALLQPEMLFAVRSHRTRAEIESRMLDDEHHACWSCPATADVLASVLENERRLTPVAVAATLLWGRTQFGEEWFRRASRRFEVRRD